MRVLHAFDRHRNGGGADNTWDQTISISRERGIEVGIFCRDSADIPDNLRGKIKAFYSGIYAPDAVRAFELCLREFKPDVVHAHELYPLISHWILPLCRHSGVPVVTYCYDFRLTCPVATHYVNREICHKCMDHGEHWALIRDCRNNRLESLSYAVRSFVTRKFRLVKDNIDQYIVPSPFVRDWLVENLAVDGTKIHIAPPAIEYPDTAADPAEGKYVAFAGRFAEEKGVELLVEAARKLNLPLRLAGFADNHPAIMSGDKALCVQPSTARELAEFYRGARMLVVPSIWYETFSIVAAEAMSHGIPVVASRIGALQSTVDDRRTGLLFEKGNVDDLADKILQLWNDPTLSRQLGAAARDKVRDRFNRNVHHENVLRAYESAAKSAPVPAMPQSRSA